METRVLRLILRLIKAWLVLACVLVTGSTARSQANGGERQRLAVAPINHITKWHDDVSGAMHLLHVMFPEINPSSKTVLVNNRDWSQSPTGIGSFAIYVCEPDLPPTEEEQRDILVRYHIHCSALTIYADFLMGGSQLGPVPAWILIGRPALDKRWSELSASLVAHPEWPKEQVQDAMRASGVKYGEDSRNEVMGPIHDGLTKLEPFLGKLTVDSIDYSPYDLSKKSDPVPPGWVVKAHPAGQDRTKPLTKYVLVFNVFDGAFESEQKF